MKCLGKQLLKRCPVKTQKSVKVARNPSSKSPEGVDEKPPDARELNPLSIHACKYWSLDKLATVPRNIVSGLVLVAKSMYQ
ncbi:hypothetical protein RHGRI_006301 [Rhododendron griersonianum]|uniref:Uncharacterized protein n=1 Tax=Rhododendron griersonianum TaxID=479676 RepID=A0AAV6KT66_9ERIC|nr:hypothetical protein RHGRI_006301 [Rhododendron griersonianum]